VYVCLVSGDAEYGGDPVGGVEDPGNGRRVRVLHLHLHPDDDVVPPFCTNSQRSFFVTKHEIAFSSTKVMNNRCLNHINLVRKFFKNVKSNLKKKKLRIWQENEKNETGKKGKNTKTKNKKMEKKRQRKNQITGCK
jgi:hypothetical protein